MTAHELQILVEGHVAKLREHVDVVRIFVSVDPEEGTQMTRSSTSGSGNIFAQLGQVKDWLIEQDELTRREVGKEEDL